MPDKKLTDNEIKKALEDLVKCNNNEIDCDNCSLSVFYPRCPEEIGELSLDLINRLQAENKKNENIIRLADKTIATLQAENERLNNCVKSEDEVREIAKRTMEPLVRAITKEQIDTAAKLAKAEAYKDCIEKVKNELKNIAKIDWQDNYYYLVGTAFFDNLLKDLVGE